MGWGEGRWEIKGKKGRRREGKGRRWEEQMEELGGWSRVSPPIGKGHGIGK